MKNIATSEPTALTKYVYFPTINLNVEGKVIFLSRVKIVPLEI